MNLQRSRKECSVSVGHPAAPEAMPVVRAINFGRICPESPKSFMMLCRSLIGAALVCGLCLFSSAVQAQTNYYVTNGIEYSLVGSLPGDQIHPDVAITPAGGYVVWQDNVTDGSGWGISARRLDDTLSGTLSTFRVNQIGTNNQENPRVAVMKDGGAVFVWQGGVPSYQHIYAAFQAGNGTFLNTTDVVVNASTNSFQTTPAVAVLNNSNVVVVYSSFNQAGPNTLEDVYGQVFSPLGNKIGKEFLVNQFTNFNQRSASIAALGSGGFIVTWVSEQQRLLAPVYGDPSPGLGIATLVTPSVDVMARTFDSNANPITQEFIVNNDNKPCSSPSVAVAADGSFMITWAAHNDLNPVNGWDIYARHFSSSGTAGAVIGVNTYLYGDQVFPRISSLAKDYMITWTSFGQDGSREGVYAQQVQNDGSTVGSEFRVNTVTLGPQLHPVVASDGVSQYLFVWTTFSGPVTGFDLDAQRYINARALLLPMEAPYVQVPFTFTNGAYEAQLVVSWPPLLGLSVSNFEVYVDGSGVPGGIVTSNGWTWLTSPSSTHVFTVDYVTTDGRRSPLSPATSGTTWEGLNWGGIPFEWMEQYFGNDASKWPSATADSDGDGVNNFQEFLAGTNPTNAASVLKQELVATQQGLFLTWNTQPGLTYQVISTTNFGAWNNFGTARFATGTNDSVYVGSNPGYYRIVLQR